MSEAMVSTFLLRKKKRGFSGLTWELLEPIETLTGKPVLPFQSYLLFNHQVVSDPLPPHGLEHTRPPCPSPSPGVCPSSCSLSQRCHPTISFFEPALLLPPSLFPSIRILPNESVLRIRWPKYWSCSCSVSPSNEYSGLISFKVDWFDLLAVQDSQESSPAPQSESINSLALSLLYGPTLTSVHDY